VSNLVDRNTDGSVEFEPLERRPSRLSQTALKHADACPRSGYLYLKHRGGALWALVLARVRKRRFDRGPMEVAA